MLRAVQHVSKGNYRPPAQQGREGHYVQQRNKLENREATGWAAGLLIVEFSRKHLDWKAYLGR